MGADKKSADDRARQFGEKLAALRKSRGVSRRELAARCGTCEPSISPYEHGLRLPRLSLIDKIAEVLQVSPLALVPWWRPNRLHIDVGWKPGANEYVAVVVKSPDLRASGKTAAEAIGRLFVDNPEKFGLDLRIEGKPC